MVTDTLHYENTEIQCMCLVSARITCQLYRKHIYIVFTIMTIINLYALLPLFAGNIAKVSYIEHLWNIDCNKTECPWSSVANHG